MDPQDATKRLIGVRELARLAGLSEPTIRRLARDRRIPFFQPGGRGGKLLFPPDAIQRAAGGIAGPPQAEPGPAAGPPRLAGPRPRWMSGRNP
jgi:excisionase family DNA binding protein